MSPVQAGGHSRPGSTVASRHLARVPAKNPLLRLAMGDGGRSIVMVNVDGIRCRTTKTRTSLTRGGRGTRTPPMNGEPPAATKQTPPGAAGCSGPDRVVVPELPLHRTSAARPRRNRVATPGCEDGASPRCLPASHEPRRRRGPLSPVPRPNHRHRRTGRPMRGATNVARTCLAAAGTRAAWVPREGPMR